MKIENCALINFPKIQDVRGNLTFIEARKLFPFNIERVFYLYDVPAGADRAGHAHKELHEFLIPVSGSFDITLDDGFNKKTVHLNRPYQGLHVPPTIWRQLDNFSSSSVCLVLCSHHYDENDYYRDYTQFIKIKNDNV